MSQSDSRTLALHHQAISLAMDLLPHTPPQQGCWAPLDVSGGCHDETPQAVSHCGGKSPSQTSRTVKQRGFQAPLGHRGPGSSA